MQRISDAEASGGAYLSIEKSSEVKWNIPVDKTGYYQVVIRYRTEGGDKMQYLLKNDSEIACGFDMSANWKLFSQAFLLDSGINRLGIRDGWGGMDIDWIGIDPPLTEFGISPHKHTFYKNAPHDLVFKIDNFNQQIQEVRLNGQSLAFSQIPYPYQESAIWLEIKAQD